MKTISLSSRCLCLSSFCFVSTLLSASAAVAPATIPIWPSGAPGTESWTQQEEWYGDAMNGAVQGLHVRNVTVPALQVFAAPRDKASGTGVIIAPGGGFTAEAWEKEGTLMAEWLQQRGVSSFVLKYRLTPQAPTATATAEAAAGGARAGRRGGAPTLQVPGASAGQQTALSAMEQGLASQVLAAGTARTNLLRTAFSDPANSTELRAKTDALRMAEQELASARVEAFLKLQSSADKLDIALVTALISAQTGGARAGGRGGNAAAGGLNIQELALADGKQAMRYVKEHAATWAIDPAKLGFVGFSAGGFIAIRLAVDPEPDTRPAFVGSVYGCCAGNSVTAPPDATPIFLASSYNDGISFGVHTGLVQAWKAVNRPAEIHLYATGGHGWGMAQRGLPHDTWIDRFGDWLRNQKLLNP